VQETQKGVQSLNAEQDRIKTLIKIRDALGVLSTVRLDSRTTQTCADINHQCLDGTGSWLWTHEAYTTWTAPKDKDTSHVLLVSGPRSSGKTLVSSLITKHLEDQKGARMWRTISFPPVRRNPTTRKTPCSRL
jgi:Cdc6-like AAA superfamily ATPase